MPKDNSAEEKKKIDYIDEDATFEIDPSEVNEYKDTPFSGESHGFDPKVAVLLGSVELAILVRHFAFWVRFNRMKKGKKNPNLRDGRCWTYQSRADIQIHFPYWSVDEVRRLCEKLVEKGVLITANYNRNPHINKTLWYAFKDEKHWGVDENSKNVYERQKCQSSGKIATRPAKLPHPTDTKSSDTETTDGISNIGHDSVHNPASESELTKTDAIASDLSTYLFEEIQKRMPKFKKPNMKEWAAVMHRMVRIDKREVFEIMEVITWLKNDDWYAANILSPTSLRKKFDEIVSKMMLKDKKTLMSQNRQYAVAMKKQYAQEMKGLTFNEKCAWNCYNTDSGKEASFDLPHETFKNILLNMFGGKPL